jgi:hypothetical protein
MHQRAVDVVKGVHSSGCASTQLRKARRRQQSAWTPAWGSRLAGAAAPAALAAARPDIV